MNTAGIMGGLPRAAVDVRDMLCAQALAVVAGAWAHGGVSETLAVSYNAEDVRRDLCAWAGDRRLVVRQEATGLLTIGPMLDQTTS